MTKTNLLFLEKFKEKRSMLRTEEHYRYYLKTLANSQLEIEINYLLDEFSGDDYDQEFHSKGRLILQEISSRADFEVKPQIDLLNRETFKLI